MSDQVTVMALFEAAPGRADDLAALLAEFVDAVRAEEGAVVYTVHRGSAQPETFWFYEVYRNADAFAVHGRAPEFGELAGRLAGLLAKAPVIVPAHQIAGFGTD